MSGCRWCGSWVNLHSGPHDPEYGTKEILADFNLILHTKCDGPYWANEENKRQVYALQQGNAQNQKRSKEEANRLEALSQVVRKLTAENAELKRRLTALEASLRRNN